MDGWNMLECSFLFGKPLETLCSAAIFFAGTQVLTSAGTQAEVSSTTASIQTQVVLGWIQGGLVGLVG